MAKSKKSKILAMALCASVMTGIYASPVMAAGEITGINVTGIAGALGAELAAEDSVKINGVTLKNYGIVEASQGNFANAVTIKNGWLNIGEGKFYVNATDGNTEIEGTLKVTGNTTLGVLNAGATTLDSLTVTGPASLNGGLNVSGAAKFNGMLTADAGLTVTSNGIEVEDGGLLVEQGLAELNGGLSVTGGAKADSLEVTGNTTLNGLTATGAANLNGGLNVTGGAKADSLEVTGDTTLNGLTATGAANLNGGLNVTGGTETDELKVTGVATVDSLKVTNNADLDGNLTVKGELSAANNKFGVDVDGNIRTTGGANIGGDTTIGGALTVTNNANITGNATVGGGLNVTGNATVGGSLGVTGGANVTGGFTVTGGSTLSDGLTVNGFTTLNNGLLVNGDAEIDGKLKVGSVADVEQSIVDLEAYAKDLQDADLPEKVGGIERDPLDPSVPAGEGVTTIEGMAKFDSEGMTIGETVVNDGKITVGAAGNQTVIEGGAITAKSLLLDGKNVGETIFGIERDPENEVTTIEGATSFDSDGMSIKGADGFGTSLGVDSMEITAAGGLSTRFTAGGATFVGASGTTNINGGAIQTTTINGVNFTEWHDKVDDRLDDLEGKTQNIKPGTGAGTGTGEGGTAAGEGNNIIDVPATEDGHTGINGNVTVGGEINAGEIVVGDKGSDNKTTIDGGNITTGDTTIDGDGIKTGNGNFTGNVDVDGKVTVGEGTTITGEGITTGTGTFDDVIIGENTTIDGDGMTVGEGTDIKDGNITVSGENGSTTINGGNITTGDTTIDGDGIKTNDINAGTGTIGNVDMNNTGIIVGDGTSITNDTVKAQNGDFDNLTAGSGTFGTGDNQTTINNDGVTVGSENGTSITGEGITVGDKNGVSIKNDEVRVGGGEDGKGGSYMNDTDVVSGEGVSLNDTAERVGHLENRVGKLEDRIDKVGAMSAAIANLRTMGYDPAAPTEIAVGVGQYRSETGVALGMFHYPNRDFMLSLSVSTSGDEVMGGIGATWKFGRKSPEKVAEIKKAQAEADARRAEEAKLAKAEAMKKAAKEAKIKAQQERHAKLAAERAAQAEAAK